MKQKGKSWINSKGESTLAKYLPPYEQACERIGQKVASVAEDIEVRLSRAKYDLLRLCEEMYTEYLKLNQPVKRFSFTTFDKTHKIEFDVNEKYIRVYRANKKDPSYKDYTLIVMDFSGANALNLPITEEETAERLSERELNSRPLTAMDDDIRKYPLTEKDLTASEVSPHEDRFPIPEDIKEAIIGPEGKLSDEKNEEETADMGPTSPSLFPEI